MKIRPVVSLSFAASIGVITAGCGSFASWEASPLGATSGSGSAGSGVPDAGLAATGADVSSGASSGDGTGPTGSTTGASGSDPGAAGASTTGATSGADVTGSDTSGATISGASTSGNSTADASMPGSGSTGASTSGAGSTGASTSGSGSTGMAMSGTATTGSSSGSTPNAGGPCDVLGGAGQKCAAAHSTVRGLLSSYTGKLYQLTRADKKTMDIGQIAGGYADAASHDTFCAGSTCTITIIYDQAGNGNDLTPAPAGGFKKTPDIAANASDLKTTVNGHEVYGVLIKPGIGYRKLVAKGTATGDQPETEYMITSAKNLVDQCCFDYGNAETDAHDDGNGTMEAVYFGGGVVWGTGSPGGHQNGPWVMADLENGLFAGWENNQDLNISTNTPVKFDYVTAALVGDVGTKNGGKGRFALYAGDATNGTLKTMYDGIRPQRTGYVPMLKQGSVIMGIGGDNSDSDGGEWFEGVMANGASTLATMNALQANIVAAKYGK